MQVTDRGCLVVDINLTALQVACPILFIKPSSAQPSTRLSLQQPTMSATITGSVPEQASNPLSPSHTLIDLQAEKDKASSVASPPASEKGAERRASSTSDATVASVDENDLSNLPPMRKNILLLCFVSIHLHCITC